MSDAPLLLVKRIYLPAADGNGRLWPRGLRESEAAVDLRKHGKRAS